MYDATRGVDVGTKAEIYRLMREQCQMVTAILFYSTDVTELVNLSDRPAGALGISVIRITFSVSWKT